MTTTLLSGEVQGDVVTIKVRLFDDQELLRFGSRTILSSTEDIEIVGEASDLRLKRRKVPYGLIRSVELVAAMESTIDGA